MRQNFDYVKYIEDLKFNKNDPHPGLADNASFLAFYGTQQALWEGAVAYTKVLLENRESEVKEEIRNSEAKVAANVVDARSGLDKEIQKLKKELAIAKTQDALYTNACKALAERGNNLRSIGTWLRAEKGFTNATSYQGRSPEENSLSSEEKQEVLRRVSRSSAI